MVQHSWFYRNGLFYTILVLVLLIHLILLAMRMYKDWDVADAHVPKPSLIVPPLKIKIISDHVTTKKQIVQSEDPKIKETPKKKSYLSDKDRSFDRETIARKVDIFKAAGKGDSAKEKISLADLGAFGKGHDPLKIAASKYKSGKKSAASASNDFVKAVPLGDVTNLNTVEYKYYGFFYRIRQKLEQFWGRSIQEKAEFFAKQKRRIASDNNLITSLEVTLNEVGQIVNIVVKGTSGIQELDTAAIESFNEAGPFPNPPKGLIQDGLVKIEWGFVINT